MLNNAAVPVERASASRLELLFHGLLPRFQANHPNAPANAFVWGFITPEPDALSITIDRTQASLTAGVRDAEYLVYGTQALLEAVFDPANPNRAALVEQLDIRPHYPFNNYLLSIFLNAFDLAIPDLDYVAKRFDGPFPFPPRYPAAENPFRLCYYQPAPLPAYDSERLPGLIADDYPLWVAMYEKAWQLAFRNLRQPEADSGFVASFIDPAFNANTFLWDSCFMMLFGHYGRRVFPFLGTLDNFYAKQHDDGFICREINTYSGTDLFQSLDPRSTGPNLLAWTEWLVYQHSGDNERLRDIFPVLIAYHRWWKMWRTHRDGSYWTSGWGSGMDNQTRVPQSEYHHRGYAWVDATMQQALNCRVLLDMAAVIGRDEFDAELSAEYRQLKAYIHTNMWDEQTGFYYDVAPDGTLSGTKTIGAYWGLLGDVVPETRAARMIAHLDDPKSFRRPHRVPTQAHDSQDYNPYGGYWLGGVWSPTNYMVLAGLTTRGHHEMTFEIARNHIENVASVFRATGTLWENYAPEHAQPGRPAGRDFVGWTGVSAISIPIEYLIGVRPGDDTDLEWRIRLTGRHGILRYPVGAANEVDLLCEPCLHDDARRRLTIRTRQPITIAVICGETRQRLAFAAGEHHVLS